MSPHQHEAYRDEQFPDASVRDARNYCRNPGGQREGGVWCYTTSYNKEWEYCDVPRCGAMLFNIEYHFIDIIYL